MRTLTIQTSPSYNIFIQKGLLSKAGEYIRDITSAKTAVIVTDDAVAPLYAKTVQESLQNAGFFVETFVFPHGEESKCHKVLIKLYDFLLQKGVTRSDLLVALGGGVVGDLTGFAAASYMRGIDFVMIPTTLLSQVDSSVGGKTAVNLQEGKNIVGAFWQPRLVLCDPDTLLSLSEDILKDGVAECVKYGFIRDEKILDLLLDGVMNNIEEIITRCIAIKKQVVERDEHDHGERMILNFGHTLAHAIERYYHYQTYTHGKAVAIGMVYITRAAVKQGATPKATFDKMLAVLAALGLPTSCDAPLEELLPLCARDKKRETSGISIILAKQVGQCEIVKKPLNEFYAFFQ